ncbi:MULTISPECIES: hypothetical protein [unclassified Treponema]|uniref:hypothetical protein n=1 Tax=unclassified Treponema TaxID=2638727 RepID=UPI0020A24EDA|nr:MULTISPECIES: hypothetical protein [unclassified Treponema]UTC66573.1 hypothetical protein E4O06_11525 [Treponema sp. OMZ 789]UTC69306.1 hypothetical protein E4O01_11665 [Treponema sp. OMZ 790]UTC72020.1 hypothetical protein E4O02_11760 [Treponema sp. OMZ 791]
MKFRIGAIFSDVGISFKISHKVVKLIWNDLEKEINLSDEYNKVHKDYTLVFLYSARESNDFFVTNPTISKRYKVVEYVIYMPYKEIQKDTDIYNIFLHYMEKGIRNIFEQYNINQYQIDDIFSKIRMKVIGNKEYLP